MDQNKRVLLAITLTLLIWLGYIYLFMPKPPSPPPSESSLAEPAPSVPGVPPPAVLSEPADAPAGAAAESTTVAAGETSGETGAFTPTAEASEISIHVDGPLYRFVLSNRGAAVTGVALKRYQAAEGGPLELLPLEPSLGYVFPATLGLEADTGGSLAGGIYEVEDRRDLDLSADPDRRRIVFRRVTSEGLAVTKTFAFDPASYLIDLTVEVADLAGRSVPGRARLFLGGQLVTEPGSHGQAVVALADGRRLEKRPSPKKPIHESGQIAWVALADQYFLSALVPDAPRAFELEVESEERAGVTVALAYPAAPGARPDGSAFQLFFGPKDSDDLAALGHELQRVVDLGTFAFIARPLQRVLKWAFSFTGNYGLAIILVTIMVRFVLFPLTLFQLRSMRGMQAIQPKVAALKEQFKKNPKRLNEEVMKLYKLEGVNPFAGCLPILLQLPVFFALYTVLLNTMGLRQAPFGLWIDDLAAPDMALVILMGASQFLSQKLTPTAGDPQQARLMMFMPLLFVVMFRNLPAGLVLYWLTSNLIQIVQQLVINWRFKTAAPARAA